jgi:membrane dipeptidase
VIQSVTVVDLHSDLLLDLDHRRIRGERDVFRRIHLPVFQAIGLRVQVLAVFIESAYLPEGALRTALRLVEAALREEEESEGALRLVRSEAELDQALGSGAVAGILSLEGAEPLGRDPGLVKVFERLGVRLIGPVWNRANAFADGVVEATGPGLTVLGERLLAEMEELGIALDLSHLSPRGCERALQRFEGTVLASHSNSASVWPNGRNAPDELLEEIGRRDGVCGLNAVQVFVGHGDVHERLADHAEAISRLAGGAAPAFGCDFTDYLPAGPAEPAGIGLPPDSDPALIGLAQPPRETLYAGVADTLRGRGWAEQDVQGLLSENALRLLRRCLV